MALKTVVKVGGITNLTDARYCAGMGVDFLGFKVVDGEPGSISRSAFQDIRGWVTGPQIVAEVYGIKSAADLATIIEGFHPDYLELGLAEWSIVGSSLTLPFILNLEAGESLPPMTTQPAYILTRVDNHSISQLIPENDILAQVTTKEQLDYAMKISGISGLNLQGSEEIRPGLKQYDDLAEILEALEIE